jgi:hypothetical protein
LELAITINLEIRAYPRELSALINKLVQTAKTLFTDLPSSVFFKKITQHVCNLREWIAGSRKINLMNDKCAFQVGTFLQ